jgi:hypothetical protein
MLPDNYEVEGQMTIFDFIRKKEPIFSVLIKGLCDDAYCPRCKACIDDRKYLDSEKCPHCGLRIDWSPWHRANDDMEESDGDI